MAEASAIVSARNEAPTVGAVVRALAASGRFKEIIVVSDGSADATVGEARRAGAIVIDAPRTRGKAQAMRVGARRASADVVAFFDGDLLKLAPAHVGDLLDPVVRGETGMVAGVVDRGACWNAIAMRLPPITGQRALRREIVLGVPKRFMRGYGAEAAINGWCAARGVTCRTVVLRGLGFRKKIEKVGLLRGIAGYATMLKEVLATMIAMRISRGAERKNT